jgi:hypothetical protein
VEILLGFECKGAERFPQLVADIHFTTHVGAVVTSQSNWYTGESFGALPERGQLVCRIPRLTLLHGVYRLDVSLYARRRRWEPVDEMRHAADLRVIQGNFYASGRLPGPKDGPTLLEGSWSLEKNGA